MLDDDSSVIRDIAHGNTSPAGHATGEIDEELTGGIIPLNGYCLFGSFANRSAVDTVKYDHDDDVEIIYNYDSDVVGIFETGKEYSPEIKERNPLIILDHKLIRTCLVDPGHPDSTKPIIIRLLAPLTAVRFNSKNISFGSCKELDLYIAVEYLRKMDDWANNLLWIKTHPKKEFEVSLDEVIFKHPQTYQDTPLGYIWDYDTVNNSIETDYLT